MVWVFYFRGCDIVVDVPVFDLGVCGFFLNVLGDGM